MNTNNSNPIKTQSNKISVIGDGGWGTTLAVHLARNNQEVNLWGPFPEYVRRMKKNRYNPKFLPGVRIPAKIKFVEDLNEAVADSGVLVFAIPSKYAKNVLKDIKKVKTDLNEKIFLSVTKGFDMRTLQRISELVNQELGNIPFCVLSGPTIAMEVAKGLPSTAVVASAKIVVAEKMQQLFNSESFRVYTNNDVIGVELGGSVKNVIAIACGVCDGLGFGSNTKAAILTRGLAEMSRLGKVLGANPKTFSGLSGLGDLVTTCVSPQSRNRTIGEKLAKGKSIDQILKSMEMVAEGVETVKAIMKLSEKHDVYMPISTEVFNIIYKKKKPQKAVQDLMTREAKPEN